MSPLRTAGVLASLVLAHSAWAQPRDVAIAAETTSAQGNPRLFVASRDAQTRKGDVIARRSDDTAATAPLWSAANMLDAQPMAGRSIVSADTTGLGFALDWAQLTAPQRSMLASHGLGQTHLAYLRGDRSQEGVAPGWRPRASRMGEILNSNLWLTRPAIGTTASPMLYVGSSDGMLHGFDASDGSEKLAYLPRGLLPRLAALIRGDDLQHHYVDGPVFAGQVPIGPQGAARTMLVGTLGAGGKGFFVLDISDIDTSQPPRAVDLVHTDRTDTADPDVGQIHAPPVVDGHQANRARQIVRLNGGRWAALMGNGYFSQRGRPVLLIQFLDGARELMKLSPCVDGQPCAAEGANGLSAPQPIDVDGDGTVDVAYAGDLHGNLWKFDLSSDPAAGGSWRVAFAGQPFFVARGPDGQPQPITTAPHWATHPRGGLMLAFGTGRHLVNADTADTHVQSIYGLHDDSAIVTSSTSVRIVDGTPISSSATPGRPSTLVQQRYGTGIVDGGTTYYHASSDPVLFSGTTPHGGWWVDLPLAGQRVLQNPRPFEGHKLLVYSVLPSVTASDPTGAGRVWTAGRSFVSVLNIMTGHPPTQPAFWPQDSTINPGQIGMAEVPQGPPLQQRVGSSTQQLRFPDRVRLTLRSGTTSGARTGWRERQ